MTYAELNRKANQLARYLRNRGIGCDHLVGLCAERGLEMVVAMLGILKAGAGYLPLDPNYPTERLQLMLEDAAPRVVLLDEDLKAVLPVAPAQVVALNATLLRVADHAKGNLAAADIGLTVDSLLYVIYTSGSTGRPKGTAMPHRSMANLIEWHRRSLAGGGSTRVLQFAALSFDVAFQETFSTLCTGGTLVLLHEWVRRDARALTVLLLKQSVERLFAPPLVLQSLAEYCISEDITLRTMRDVITAGEQLRISPEIVSFFEHLGDCRLHNHYGPTESHVVTALTLDGNPRAWPQLPSIGRPIANCAIYVLDAERRPVPLGIAGEIYIGGANIARGYLNRPELTAERFVPDPFSADPQARMYKTGDLGRWKPDGTIEYLGRNDDQVKIRGHRVELGEIEARLRLHGVVKDAVVTMHEDVPGDKRLVAYVTSYGERSQPSAELLRAWLKAALPDHMVPAAFVALQTLPLTPSGKVNRRALPAPELGAFASRQFAPPQGETEEGLAEIWRALLRVERVGREDNFFELGGHSLHGMKLIAQVEARFGVRLSVVAVFQYPSVLQMAQLVDSLRWLGVEPGSAEADGGDEYEEGVVDEFPLATEPRIEGSAAAARQ